MPSASAKSTTTLGEEVFLDVRLHGRHSFLTHLQKEEEEMNVKTFDWIGEGKEGI